MLRPERPAVQLVEHVGRRRRARARTRPSSRASGRCGRRGAIAAPSATYDEVPRRVRQVEHRDVVAPAARARARRRRALRPPSPCHDPSAEREPAQLRRPRSRRRATPRACGRRGQARVVAPGSTGRGTSRPRASRRRSARPAAGRPPRTCSSQSGRHGAGRHAELEPGDRPARTDDARQLAQRRGRVVDVAQEVGERERVELAVGERQAARRSPRRARSGRSARRRASASISGLWSTPTTVQPVCRTSSRATAPVPVATSRHAVARAGVDARDEEAPPAWILAVREQRGVAVVRRAERREERLGPGRAGPQGESRGGAPRVRR